MNSRKIFLPWIQHLIPQPACMVNCLYIRIIPFSHNQSQFSHNCLYILPVNGHIKVIHLPPSIFCIQKCILKAALNSVQFSQSRPIYIQTPVRKPLPLKCIPLYTSSSVNINYDSYIIHAFDDLYDRCIILMVYEVQFVY